MSESGSARAATPLFDMHCHLDFADGPAQVAALLAQAGVCALSATVTPEGYEAARVQFAGFANVRVGLGLHPWWVADGRCGEASSALFEKLAPAAPVIAEVGLDFAPRREGTFDVQRAAFERVLRACMAPEALEAGRKVLSLHAVRSACAVLDALEREGVLERHVCVLHWFSGTSDELARAIRAGCFFSVGERMLASKRGRAYVRAIPENRLLLETDGPAEGACAERAADSLLGGLSHTLELLAEARGRDVASLGHAVAQTSADLLGAARS